MTVATAPLRRRTRRAWLDAEVGAIYVFGAASRSDAIQHIGTHGVRYRTGDGGEQTFRPLLDPHQACTGWFRIVPGCPDWCGAGHPWHYYEAKPRSSGTFPYVLWWTWQRSDGDW